MYHAAIGDTIFEVHLLVAWAILPMIEPASFVPHYEWNRQSRRFTSQSTQVDFSMTFRRPNSLT